jgi:hypothetical protein
MLGRADALATQPRAGTGRNSQRHHERRRTCRIYLERLPISLLGRACQSEPPESAQPAQHPEHAEAGPANPRVQSQARCPAALGSRGALAYGSGRAPPPSNFRPNLVVPAGSLVAGDGGWKIAATDHAVVLLGGLTSAHCVMYSWVKTTMRGEATWQWDGAIELPGMPASSYVSSASRRCRQRPQGHVCRHTIEHAERCHSSHLARLGVPRIRADPARVVESLRGEPGRDRSLHSVLQHGRQADCVSPRRARLLAGDRRTADPARARSRCHQPCARWGHLGW